MSQASFLAGLAVHRRVLGNGLVVLVHEDPGAPVVAVVTHVKAGYFDEPDPIVGISHVLEHMYFKGTERRGVGEIARETKAAGGYLNAGTIYDHTSYYTVLPAGSLAQALDIQADALQHSAIDEDELRRELQVIIQEARRKLDNPEAVAQEKLFEAMFDTHRIRRWRIGAAETLTGFTRAEVVRYYRALYQPSNTVVAVAGAVSAAEAFALVEQYYGGMPAGDVLRDPGPPERPASGFRLRELSGDIMHTYLEWGWRTPGTLHAATPELDVLALILGQGRASRLYRHVRDAGLVTGISAYNYTPTQLGVFGVSAELLPEHTERAVAAIAAVVAGLTERISAAEVARAHNILEARLVRRVETAEGQARLLAEWEALGGWELAARYLDGLLGTTPESLQGTAARYLPHELGTLLLYRPERAASVDAAGLLAASRARAPVGVPAAEEVPPRAPDVASPGRHAADTIEDDVEFHTTPGGLRIAILRRPGIPLVSLAVHFPGGLLAEGAATAGTTSLLARSSVKGTTALTGTALAERTEALGSSISPAVSADGFSWSMTVPTRHTLEALELLAQVVLEPRLAAAEVEREQRIALSDLEQLRDDMYNYPLHLALERGFGEHPYGRNLQALAESLRAADAARVRRWHATHVLGRAPWVLAVGDILDPDALAAAIDERFAVGSSEALEQALPVARWRSTPADVVEPRRKAQTAIVLAFPGPPRNHPDRHALRVFANTISGLGGRLFEELRSRRSLAYAVVANPIVRWRGGCFVAYIGTAPDREQEATQALLRELLSCAADELPGAEIERAKRYTVGARQIRRQSNAGQLAMLADALLFGTGMAELRDFEGRIHGVTAGEIRDAASHWLDPARLVTAVVRGSSDAVD